jgi:hypothetical protein
MYPFSFLGSGIDAQAQAHYNRVIADGGLIPSGLDGVNTFFTTVKTIYGTSDINTAISVGLDPQVLGYKLGAGSGTTLGQAAQKLYSPKDVFGGIGTGSAFWEGSGVAGNFVSTPNAAANQITGDIEIVAKVSFNTLSGYQMIISKANGNSYRLYKDLNVKRFVVEFGGKGGATSDLFTFDLQEDFWIKVNRVSLTGVVIFYKSTDGITYNQVGTTKSTTSGNFNNSSGLLEVGADGAGSQNLFTGKIYRVTISNSIGGTPVVDFNPNQYTGANTWTSTTSEVWTVNSTGAGLADVVQTTAASQPLLLVHSGANYFFGSGVVQNYCSTSITVLSSTTTDFEIKAQINLQNYSSNGYSIVGQYVAGNNNFLLFIRDGILEIYFVVAGTGYSYNSTVAVGFTNNTDGYIKVTRDSATGAVKYYISTDGSTYAQLGATVSGVNGAITPPTTSALEVGMYENINGAFQGKIYRVTISNSIGGAPVVDFNPNQYNAATSQTQWTSSTGEVWTINTGTVVIGYKGVLVDRTIVQGDGISSFLSGFDVSNLPNNYSLYGANRLYTSTGSGNVFGASLGGDQFFHFYINSNTFIKRWSSGPDKDFGTTLNLLTYTGTGTGAGSVETMERNNAGINTVSNARPVKNSGVAVSVFASSSSGNFASNTTVNTLIIANSIDNSTPKTAMYNYIKLINNNAF